jgi:hypothetical protein
VSETKTTARRRNRLGTLAFVFALGACQVQPHRTPDASRVSDDAAAPSVESAVDASSPVAQPVAPPP